MGLGFGLERIGILCLRAPVIGAIAVIIASLIAAIGISRINVDDSLSELFRADTEEFRRFETMAARFPSSEYDVLIVIEGKHLLSHKALEPMRSLILEMGFVESAKGQVSMFSVREPPDEEGYPAPLFPASLPTGAEFEQLKKNAIENRIIKGKLLSDDGQLALVVVALDRAYVAREGLAKAVGGIQEVADQELKGSGLTWQLSGAPVMQLEIRNAVRSDRILYNGAGFLLGALICLIFFRRLELMVIAAAAPAIAILCALGALGFMGFKLNLFLNVITPLVMVISFSSSMHMVFAIRRRLMAGGSKFEAGFDAVKQIGPACALTSLTTALAILSLTLSDSALIRTFGLAASVSAMIGFLAVITVVPTLTMLLIRKESSFAETFKRHDRGMKILGAVSDGLERQLERRPYSFAVAGIAFVVIAGFIHFTLEPRYRLADQVPDKEQALKASGRLDEKLTGANPIHVLIEWKKDRGLYDDETLTVISEIHGLVETAAGLGNVWSLDSLRRWLAEGGELRTKVLKKYVGLLPRHLTGRFISEGTRSAMVTGRIPDIDASQLLPVIDGLETALAPVRKKHPEYTISVTGLAAVAARNSSRMIGLLNLNLISTIGILVILIAIAFRSVEAGILSIVPNLFPIFAAGTLLFIEGAGLQFASIIALTVSFGLAVDGTIHYLHRLRLEEETAVTPLAAVARTTNIIGQVLTLTTVVLVFGLAVTVFSDLPSLRLFGRLCGVALAAALIGDLVILPAMVLVSKKLFGALK